MEYLMINVTPASDVKVLTRKLNEMARRGWHLRHQAYTDNNAIQFTFEREYNSLRTEEEGRLDAEAKQKKAAEAKAEMERANALTNKKYAGLAGKQ
jgi:hypothetical protein